MSHYLLSTRCSFSCVVLEKVQEVKDQIWELNLSTVIELWLYHQAMSSYKIASFFWKCQSSSVCAGESLSKTMCSTGFGNFGLSPLQSTRMWSLPTLGFHSCCQFMQVFLALQPFRLQASIPGLALVLPPSTISMFQLLSLFTLPIEIATFF
jgi:hypothetical protein